MHNAGRYMTRAFGCLVVLLLLVACGDAVFGPASGAGGGARVRYGTGNSVETEAAAIAAVREHLFDITSCQAARDRIERDLAEDRFTARQVFAYQARNPVWEVAVAGDMHIPFVIWFVEQSDGTVVPSISAATYYESPLLHTCGQIYAATGGRILLASHF